MAKQLLLVFFKSISGILWRESVSSLQLRDVKDSSKFDCQMRGRGVSRKGEVAIHWERKIGCGRESLGDGGCQNLTAGCLAGYALGQGSPTPRPQTCGMLGTDDTAGGER